MNWTKIPIWKYIVVLVGIIFVCMFISEIYSWRIRRASKEKIREVYKKRLEYLDNVTFYQIPRSMVPELEGALQEIETLFLPFEGFDLYGPLAFDKDSDDYRLQKISNSTFNPGWGKELYFYEFEQHKANDLSRDGLSRKTRAHTLRSNEIGPNGEKGKRIIRTLKATQRVWKKNWVQTSGTLVHRYLKVLGAKYVLQYKKYIQDIKGLFYYPPGGFREWHTNIHDDTSWRLYYIHATEDGESWFRYVPVGSNKTVLVPDRSGYFNMFRLRKKKSDMMWHSVYSDTHRFSVGFKITSMFAYDVVKRYHDYLETPPPSDRQESKTVQTEL